MSAYRYFEAVIRNTGLPMDGHFAVISNCLSDPDEYLLCGWKKVDDDIFAKSMFQSEEEVGLSTADNFEDFLARWRDGTWSPDGCFVLDANQVEITKELML